MSDEEIIDSLLSEGYHVAITDPWADKFTEKYKVYLDVGWDELKRVFITSDGKVVGLQG